ncbi:hypothetical protein E4U41_001138 [Claviceps citrina]|nr:hypothetical protein E4U41_001138 [Claviceps citrina]
MPTAAAPATLLPQGPTGDNGSTNTINTTTTHTTRPRKRKADTQDNERLSKRLSLLNLERTGAKLYVPVETPSPSSPSPALAHAGPTNTPAPAPPAQPAAPQNDHDDSPMHLDDSAHKVYIYNLDDELTSESEDEDGKLVFLPDVERHLRENRIPPHVLANSEGQLAGMQLVLYSDPRSLSVPEERDGVRKAILESRQRAREKQRLELGGATYAPSAVGGGGGGDDDDDDVDEMDLD